MGNVEKQILLPQTVKSEMQKTFGVNRCTLGRALKYEANSSQAKMLRAAALQRGGLIYSGNLTDRQVVPVDVLIEFDHEKGMMYQTIGERVRVEINQNTGDAAFFLDGEQIADFGRVTVAKWGNVLFCAEIVYRQTDKSHE